MDFGFVRIRVWDQLLKGLECFGSDTQRSPLVSELPSNRIVGLSCITPNRAEEGFTSTLNMLHTSCFCARLLVICWLKEFIANNTLSCEVLFHTHSSHALSLTKINPTPDHIAHCNSTLQSSPKLVC